MSDNFTNDNPAIEGLESGEAHSGWCRNSEGQRVRPKLMRLSDVTEKPIEWLWHNKIPCGALSLIAGLPGRGKTFFTIYLVDCVTNGVPWADESPCKEGSVLVFEGEDGLADTYKRRCRENAVNQERVVVLSGAEVFGQGYDTDVCLKDVATIERAINDTAERTGLPVKMVIIDPISNYWGKVSENSNAGVRSVLHPLKKLAEKTGIAFVLIQHLGKSARASAQQRVLGSTGITATCRAVWGIYEDPEDDDKRIFAFMKGNCGYDHTAVSFRILPPNGRVEILETDIPKTAEDIETEIAAAQKAAKQGVIPKKLFVAAEWLVQYLADGPKLVNGVYADGQFQGHSERTLDRAKAELGIVSDKRGFGKESITYWVLPVVDEPEQNDEGEDIGTRVFKRQLTDKDFEDP
jgi:KaiC/GvpD/RAD55 family RecA-like ATPase